MKWEIEFIVFLDVTDWGEIWEPFHKCNALGNGKIEVTGMWPNGVMFATWHDIPTRELAVCHARNLPEMFSEIGTVRVNAVYAEMEEPNENLYWMGT